MRRRRLAVAVPFVVLYLLLAAVILWSVCQRRDVADAAAERTAGGLAHVLVADLETRIEALEAALAELAAYSRRSGGPNSSGEGWVQILSAVRAGLAGIGSISVTDNTGTITFSSAMESMGRLSFDGAIFQALTADPASDALVTDLPQRSLIDGNPVVPVGRVIREPSGALAGMLLATVAPSQIRALFASASSDDGTVVWIVHPSGETLLREPRTPDSSTEAWPGLPLSPTASPLENSGIFRGPLAGNDEPAITAYETEEISGLTVAVSIPESTALASWRNDLRMAAIFLGLAAVALAALGFYVDRRLLRPLPSTQ